MPNIDSRFPLPPPSLPLLTPHPLPYLLSPPFTHTTPNLFSAPSPTLQPLFPHPVHPTLSPHQNQNSVGAID